MLLVALRLSQAALAAPEVLVAELATPLDRDDPLPSWIVAEGCTVQARARMALQLHCPARPGPRPEVSHLRAPAYASAKGLVTSEGHGMTVPTSWAEAGITGARVHIGILDVGFSGYEDLLGTELPDDVATDFTHGSPEGSTHGAAVAEVIHDFAPDATLHLVSFSTDVEFAAGVETLVAEGVDVINGSIGFDNVWPADGTSIASQAVDGARDAGVIYVAAAGNENDKYVIGSVSPGLNGLVLLNSAPFQTVWTRSGQAYVSLRWSEPFGAAGTDLNLHLVDGDGAVCASSVRAQPGNGDPYEEISTIDCEGASVRTVLTGGPTPLLDGLTAWLYSPYGVADPTGSNNLTLPGDADGAFTVGAYTVDGEVPEWSSRGPTDDGRQKPDVVGPTGVSTVTFGAEGFDGTSASAPHGAGLAALWLDATHLWFEPERFRTWATDGAIDLDVVGVDAASGAGALYAGDVPDRHCGCGSRSRNSPFVWILGLIAARRVRRTEARQNSHEATRRARPAAATVKTSP